MTAGSPRRRVPLRRTRQKSRGVLQPGQVRRLARQAAAGDRRARERLVTRNLNLVHHVVRRYRMSGHDPEELFQVGCLGLVKAVDRFDPDRGTRFSTYAVPLILGEIQRHLRDAAPPGLGRGAYRLAQQARAVEDRLASERGRAPSAGEVAEALGVSGAELALALEAARRPASLDEVTTTENEGGRPLYERLAAGGLEGWEEAVLRALIGRLPPRQRQVVVLRYFRDRSQAEVGALLGLSQPQISRLEKRAVETLRRQWLETPPG